MDKIKIWRLLLILFISVALTLGRPTSSTSPIVEMWQPLMSDDDDLDASASSTFDAAPGAASSASASMNNILSGVNPPFSLWEKTRMRFQQHRKRGFSMLARWKPFNTLGKQRTSIRNINRALFPMNEYGELVSAETRGFSRPSGQPLRWG